MTSEWTLEALGQIVTGKTPPKSIKNAYSDSGVPFVTPKDMDGRKWTVTTERSLSHEGVRSVQKSVVPAGSVAVSCIGSDMGKAVRIPVDSVTNQQINTLIPDTEKCDPDYLYYLLSTMQQDLKDIAGGSATPILNKGHFGKVRVRLPAIWYQKQAAKILSALDDKIQVNHQINQTLEQMAQAIFKSWFVEFEPVKAKIAARERWYAMQSTGEPASPVCYADDAEPLPDLETWMNLAAMQAISGKNEVELNRLQAEQPKEYAELRATAELFPSTMQDSELGMIPEGWNPLPLYETAEYVNGAAFKAKDFSGNGSGLPIIKIAELKQGISAGTKYTNADVKEKYRIADGSVLYSWSGSPETSLEVFKWFGGEGWLNQHIFKLNFAKGQSEHFTYFLLKQMKPLLVRTAQQKQTTGLGHITVADMKRIKVPYPSPELLSAFSENIGPLYSRSSNAVCESKTLANLRDTLLPKLLSGELSVTGAEAPTQGSAEIAHA